MPDELLGDAVAVAAALERRCNDASDPAEGTPVRIFVLADTTFGSCCVDEVAAAHHNADCIVHFGRACMSPVARLPARFVFHKVEIDADACAAAIHAHAAALARPEAAPEDDRRVEALVVLVDQEHAHRAAALREAVARGTTNGGAGAGPPVVFADAAPVEALPRARAFSKAPAAMRRCGSELSMHHGPPDRRSIEPPPPAEGVSVCGGMPPPAAYRFTVSWSGANTAVSPAGLVPPRSSPSLRWHRAMASAMRGTSHLQNGGSGAGAGLVAALTAGE